MIFEQVNLILCEKCLGNLTTFIITVIIRIVFIYSLSEKYLWQSEIQTRFLY